MKKWQSQIAYQTMCNILGENKISDITIIVKLLKNKEKLKKHSELLKETFNTLKDIKIKDMDKEYIKTMPQEEINVLLEEIDNELKKNFSEETLDINIFLLDEVKDCSSLNISYLQDLGLLVYE